ncbi:MAG: protein kinase [Phycisphaerales bacterium]|nr:protein kinase [Phycisphaerales bacterium]
MHTLDQLRSGQLRGHARLDLSSGLTEFPREVFALADSLEILNLSGNALDALPADLGRLRNLRVLFCSDNRFTEVPAALGDCPRLTMVGFKANRIRSLPPAALPPDLRWLILTDNRLEELPPEVGRCRRLQKLMLAGNRLARLPNALARCGDLELLRVAANRLTELPAWLSALPRLAWLGCAANPFCERAEADAAANHSLGTVDWRELAVGERLGEGASGAVHAARWARDGPPADVVVKLFRGGVTSDGLPQSEMAAGAAAGRHPNLISVLGRVVGHPAGADGLVMGRIGPAFGRLAGPPSLASCTRDVYAADARFPLGTVLRVASGVAAAAAHLHARGVAHGDLYAHNVLSTPAGDALLGDFGAASFFDRGDGGTARLLQRIEVRAFGCLLEELLARCPETEGAPEVGTTLAALQRRCVQPDVSARPSMAEVSAALAAV